MGNSAQDRAGEEVERLRRELEAETRACLELQGQLDRASGEFEEFVSMAAHNLRESLRDVAAFTQLLAESHASGLDGDARMCLERIQEGAARMQSLLAGVVDYWAAGTGDGQSRRIQMEAVMGQALLSADKQIAERDAIVTHDPLPAVIGDYEVLTKVLHHLIRNAIEYCGAPSPRVHISSTRVEHEWVVAVHDNGPGIAPEFQARIFQVFKRLHGKEYPGSGLGLAFCKKVIEWQGGRMWVESTPVAGSTFYFTVAAAD
jgi:light-regulated signal transduction histidine kinase (bacteriophytochrome)